MGPPRRLIEEPGSSRLFERAKGTEREGGELGQSSACYTRPSPAKSALSLSALTVLCTYMRLIWLAGGGVRRTASWKRTPSRGEILRMDRPVSFSYRSLLRRMEFSWCLLFVWRIYIDFSRALQYEESGRESAMPLSYDVGRARSLDNLLFSELAKPALGRFSSVRL